MFRKYVIITLAAFMVFGTNACTSKKASDESADVDSVSGDDSVESADATENNDDLDTTGGKKDEAVADMGGSDDLAPEEKLPADPGSTQTADNAAVAPGDISETPPPADQAVAQNADGTTPPASEPPPAPMADAATPPPVADAAPVPEPVADAPKAAKSSLQKMKTTPYHDHGVLVNAFYIARENDSKDSIAQKVFGASSRVKDLCKVNSYNCSRDVKVGDKFYYNSPQRPTDEVAMKSFYEDAGIAPATYTAKSGDNIRKVGKTLLGNSRSWMELWATNDVESKGDLDEGTTLKYWPNSDAAAPTQTMAKNDAGAAAAAGGAAAAAGAPPTDQAGMPPGAADQGAPPAQEMAQNAPPAPDQAAPPPPPPAAGENLPPAPDQAQNAPPQAAAAGTVEPPPPPPPPADVAQNHKEPAAVDGAGMSDPNQTVALGVGAVLLLAAAGLFISIRKKRARRQIDFNTSTQTQIE